jgi:hypothetical protein
MEFKTQALLAWYRLTGCRIVHFLHIGKTGGNAIRAALGLRKDRFGPVAAGTVAGVRGHHVRLADIPAGDKVIFTLRDPIGRFVSGFNSRMRQGGPVKHRPWTEVEARAFARFKTPNELGLALSSSDPAIRSAAEEALNGIGHVKRHYAHWLQDMAYVRRRADDILFVAMVESLDADFGRIRQILQLPDRCALPQDDLVRHKTPDHMPTAIDDAARANLREWYAADYVLLEGCRRAFRSAGNPPTG